MESLQIPALNQECLFPAGRKHRSMDQEIVAFLNIIPINPFAEFMLPVSAALGSVVLELPGLKC